MTDPRDAITDKHVVPGEATKSDRQSVRIKPVKIKRNGCAAESLIFIILLIAVLCAVKFALGRGHL